MGADQSTGGNVQLKSQRDEDIPYTSYSLSKPIDGEVTRSSPRPTSRPRSMPPRDPPPGDIQQQSTQRHSIVVVAPAASSDQKPDPEIDRLDRIPVLQPIIRGIIDTPRVGGASLDIETLEKLDPQQLLQLCLRYQEHLKQCAEAVSFDQNALCVRIKEVDFAIQTLYLHLTERQKKFSKYAEQIQKINEMSSILHRVKMSVEQTIPLMERLNSVLPPGEQLEPFSMKPK
ncbi:hypothetical protein NP493_506g01034 [Ridgeia piscesae]|uniref:BLOC-1-related complex subunit 5 n=1 Tax=Ridgeia piscesae TaxID=27915 RepID=A0AAD9KXK4_RIDPI|nr:hypothetical protein NP493_506g01034 [Ridgeia piscesae]